MIEGSFAESSDGPAHADTPVIDAHHHVWDLAVRDQPWTAELPALRRTFTMDDLEPQLVASGVHGTVLVQTIVVPEETPEFLALAATRPMIWGVVGWVDLTAPDVADRLAELQSGVGGDRLVGVRHQVQEEPDPDWLLRADVSRGLTAVAKAGLAYDLLVTHDQLPAAVAAARQHPDVRFVLDHAGKPPIASGDVEPWASCLRELAAAPHVACKLSGLLTEAGPEPSVESLRPYADEVLDAFGPDRVMAGSDWPVCTLVVDYAATRLTTAALVAGLDDAELAAVQGGTAMSWYGLSRNGLSWNGLSWNGLRQP